MSEQVPFYIRKQQDLARLAELERSRPELVMAPEPLNFTAQNLARIGIYSPTPKLAHGFIKYQAQDFIVEEITGDLQVMSIEPASQELPDPAQAPRKPLIQATLVKMGMDTHEALERLSEALGCTAKDIGYAGLKDAKAITAQRVTIQNATAEQVGAVNIPHLRLQQFTWRTQPEFIGRLYGNRFAIVVRLDRDINDSQLTSAIANVQQFGFPNFYSVQRFGPRLNSHLVGRLIVHQHYEAAVRELLVGQSNHELPVFTQVRAEAERVWGQWTKMRELFEQFPTLLRYEVELLKGMEAGNGDFRAGLTAIETEARFCCYAYFSYWFNRLLSAQLAKGTPDPKLPIYALDDLAQAKYAEIMPPEERRTVRFNHKELPFLRLNKAQTVSSMVVPKIWSVLKADRALIIHFDLPKGAYATSLLSHLFELYQAKPVPEWVHTDPIDSRAMLGYWPVAEVVESLPTLPDNGDGAAPFFE